MNSQWQSAIGGLVVVIAGVLTLCLRGPITRITLRENARLWGIPPEKWKNKSWAIFAVGVGTCALGILIITLSIFLPPVPQ